VSRLHGFNISMTPERWRSWLRCVVYCEFLEENAELWPSLCAKGVLTPIMRKGHFFEETDSALSVTRPHLFMLIHPVNLLIFCLMAQKKVP